jgi:threonine synthase
MSTTAWRCECGGPLDAPVGNGFRRADIDTEVPSLWRYRRALWGVQPNPRMAFGEGLTPLVTRTWAGRELLFKLDYTLASGSFKDRGAAVMLSHLAALGVTEILEDSSGNGGAAIAAYAAAGGIRCHIYVPESTSAGKVVQLAAFGAQVHRIPGSRQATADAAAADSDLYVYASHNWQPMFIEGVKTVAFELWEQRGFRAPDAVVVPTSYGSNLLGLYRGFRELLAAGEIEKLPRLFAVQAAVVAPLARFVRDGVRGVEPHVTAAEGIAGTCPVRLDEMAEAVAASGGRVITVAEERIMAAQQSLARETGLYIEPTSAVAAAAAQDLAASNEIGSDSVVLLTGSGLKATDSIRAYTERRSGDAPE